MRQRGYVLSLIVKLLSAVAWEVYRMAFRIPNFNLPVGIYRKLGVATPYGSPDVTANGNLSPGEKVLIGQGGVSTAVSPYSMLLRLPKGTDIRASSLGGTEDVVEVPAGSGRVYEVHMVDDVAKGFGNEYRVAWIAQRPNGTTFNGVTLVVWPYPLP